MKDFWLNNVEMDKHLKLSEDIMPNVLVIGGGIAGMLCAYKLYKNGIDVVVVEKDKIGMGITKNTTATISAIQDKRYYEIINDSSFETAKLFLEANLDAIYEYKLLALELDFDFESISGILYSKDNKDVISKEYDALVRLGSKPVYHKSIELGINVEDGIELLNQGQCNPLKLINEIGKKIKVYEDTEIVKIKKGCAITKEGHKIKSRYIILCTHYPFKDKKGLYFGKMHQNRSEVVGVNIETPLNYFYVDENNSGIYARSYKNYHLYGANDRRVGICKKEIDLIGYVKKIYGRNCDYYFTNQDLITLDKLPYIGKISYWYDKILVATGFNGYGLTGAMIAASIITDMIMDRHNKYIKIFSPQRKYLLNQYFNQILVSFKNLFGFGKKRCTHMGCKLKQNEYEKTYECMCHGSRYDSEGNNLNGPAKTKIK